MDFAVLTHMYFDNRHQLGYLQEKIEKKVLKDELTSLQ